LSLGLASDLACRGFVGVMLFTRDLRAFVPSRSNPSGTPAELVPRRRPAGPGEALLK